MKKQLNNIKCECGYQNHKVNVDKYGTCRGCNKILDQKAYYHYMMNKKMNLWRFDRKKRNF